MTRGEAMFANYAEKLGEFDVIGIENLRMVASQQGITVLEAEMAALREGFVPRRYIANVRFWGVQGQLKLLSSKAVVVGCGALGGMLCELLTRLGVGEIDMIDFDVFDESNLNRQIMCTERDMGKSKASCAKERAGQINSAVCARAIHTRLDASNALSLIEGCDVVLDGLDNAGDRLALEDACLKSRIPLIHGAISDSMFQVAPIVHQSLFDNLYAGGLENPVAGTPSCTAAACAAIQTGEAVKILLGIGDVAAGAILRCDWLFWSGNVIEL